tara:strand:- start:20 stop:562 length:543 start_codon:yes stop_codon:yes gene_type:complete
MAKYIIAGGQALLGVDADGNYKLLTAPVGVNPERLAEMGPDGLKGGAARIISNDMDKGFQYLDVENMDPREVGRLKDLAQDLTKHSDGSGGTMAFTTQSSMSDKIKNIVDVMKKIKSSVGGKLPGVLGILDILGMKKEYDQIMAGEHPILNQVIDTENKPLTYKDGGYVTNPFVKDIFDN